jgi:hypothetical protein
MQVKQALPIGLFGNETATHREGGRGVKIIINIRYLT